MPKPSARFCSMKLGMSAARDEMDVDVLILVAAALADPADAVRADQREALRQHAGRGVEVAEPLDPLGGEAGLLLQLLDRGGLDRRVRDPRRRPGRREARRSGSRAPTRGWSTRITLPSYSARMTTARMSLARLAYSHLPRRSSADELALPHHLRRRQVVEVHSSISLSGISLVSSAERGKCSASTRADALDRGDDPVAGPALAHLDEQRRHRFAPGVLVGDLEDRLVGDDLGAALGHRQIDEDPGAPDGAPLGRRLEHGRPRGGGRGGAWSPPGSARAAAASI